MKEYVALKFGENTWFSGRSILKKGNYYHNYISTESKSQASWYIKGEEIKVDCVLQEYMERVGPLQLDPIKTASLHKYIEELNPNLPVDISIEEDIEDTIPNLDALMFVIQAVLHAYGSGTAVPASEFAIEAESEDKSMTFKDYKISYKYQPSDRHGYQEYGDYYYIEVKKDKKEDANETQ